MTQRYWAATCTDWRASWRIDLGEAGVVAGDLIARLPLAIRQLRGIGHGTCGTVDLPTPACRADGAAHLLPVAAGPVLLTPLLNEETAWGLWPVTYLSPVWRWLLVGGLR